MKRCCLPAYAKINLTLRVVGKRVDGYHELDTYFLQIDLADKLFFEATEQAGFEVSCNWNSVPRDETNLCVRAYNLFSQAIGRRVGARLYLEKHIPMGAGMGGGSSDAAVTLLVLNHLFDGGLAEETLLSLAGRLGSDVPFFLFGGLCHGAGRGEILTPLGHLPELEVLMVTPALEIATAQVFENLKIGLTRTRENTIFADLNFDVKKFYEQFPGGHNDLEAGVLQQHPELARIKKKLLEQNAWGASMTGSGAAVFGLFDRIEGAKRAQRELQKEYATSIARPVKCGMKEVKRILDTEVFVG